MTQYLLAVHMVDGEPEPPAEEMQEHHLLRRWATIGQPTTPTGGTVHPGRRSPEPGCRAPPLRVERCTPVTEREPARTGPRGRTVRSTTTHPTAPLPYGERATGRSP